MILLLVATLGVAAGQYSLIARRDGTLATVFYGVGIGAFLLTLLAQRFVSSSERGRMHRPRLQEIRLSIVFGSLAAVLMVASLVTVTMPGSSHISLATWALSLLLALAAAAPVDLVFLRQLAGCRALLRMLRPTAELALLCGIMLVGAALRLYDLESYPSGIHGDEAEFGLLALTILEGKGPNPFGTAFLGDAAMFLYFEAPFLALFGQTIVAVRLFAAISGALTLAAFYLFMRGLFGVRPALIGSALLAGNAVHVHYSRLALPAPQVLLFGCLALYAMWQGQRTRRPLWWFSAGVSGGLAAYFHFAARILPVIMALYLLYLLVVRGRAWRGLLSGGALSLLGGVMTLAPMGMLLWNRSSEFTGHMTSRLIFENWAHTVEGRGSPSLVTVLYEQVRTNVLAFISLGDAGFYNFARSPMLSPMLGPLVVLGIVLMLLRVRDDRYALLALWYWAVVLVNGALTIDSPQSSRLLLALLPAIAGAALVLEWAMEVGPRLLGAGLAPAFVVSAALVPAIAGFADNANYFGPAADAKPWEATTLQGKYIASLGPEYRAYVAGTPSIYFNHGVTRFLAPYVEGGSLQNPAVSLPMAVPADRDLAFLVYPHMAGYLPLLQSLYPQGQMQVVSGRGRQVAFTAFRVPRAEIARWQGLSARYGGIERVEPDASALGGGSARFPANATWTGSIFAERAGRYVFQLEGAGSEMLVDGVSLGQGREQDLAVGWHSLEVRGQLVGPEARVALKWRPPGQTIVPVAARWLDARAIAGGLRGHVSWDGGQISERRDRAIGFRNISDLGYPRRPATFVWEGIVKVDDSGRFGFTLNSTGEAGITIDGKSIVANRGDNRGLQTASAAVDLAAGPHRIAIRYVWQQEWGMLEALWAPPGGQLSIIPPEALGPPEG